ncbi:hypothetical protein [Rothia nasimurium]|uniref:hypothetical protein n=1 Tax=Rothia nasimurium TaxID=85336 RepID=UPI001F1ABE2F|nr:hypothetical protein [Rothia nasimurium]
MEVTIDNVMNLFEDVKHLLPEDMIEDAFDLIDVGEPIMAVDFIKNALLIAKAVPPEKYREFIDSWENRVFTPVSPLS